MKYFIIFLLIIAILVLMPFCLIWSVNTLFLLDIPYTAQTWLAAFILGGMLSNNHVKR